MPAAQGQRAQEEFVRAMEVWDAEAADAAIAALCRSSGAAATMEPLWRFAVRDQRNIGHKAIFAAQSWRTLQTIGWEHAEPVLRSLVFGMLDLQGDTPPAPVGPYEANLENAAKIRQDWAIGRDDPGATEALLQAIRQATPEAASAEAVKLLNAGVSPGSLWDAAVLSACELLMHNPGILTLHATTATNALHYTYTASGDDTTRRLALFRPSAGSPCSAAAPSSPTPRASTPLSPVPSSRARTMMSQSREIFTTISDDRKKAAAKAQAYLGKGGSSDLFFDAAQTNDLSQGPRQPRLQVWRGGPRGIPLVDRAQVAQPDRGGVNVSLPRRQAPDSPLMKRAREAIATVMS